MVQKVLPSTIKRDAEITDLERERIQYILCVHPELTLTEAHIFMHVEDEKSNRTIAEIYGCSIRNIENHRYRIGKKLSKPKHHRSGGERVGPHYDSPTVGERVGTATGATTARTKSRKTPASPSARPSRGRRATQVEHGGAGDHRSGSGRWLLPGVLFQLEAIDAWA